MNQNLNQDINDVRTDVGLLQKAIQENLLVAERNIAIIRCIVIVFCTLAFFLMPQENIKPFLAYTLLVIIWLYGAGTIIFEPYRKYPVMRASWFTYISDGLVTTLWLYATGGFLSPFHLIFYVSVIAVAYRFSLRVTIFTAFLYSAIYLALIIYLQQWHLVDYALLTARVGFFFILGYFTSLITRETLNQAKAKLQMAQLANNANAAEASLRELYSNLEEKYGERARELESSIKRFEWLIDAIPQMAWTAAPDGKILYLNREGYNFTGTTSKENWRLEDNICPDDVEMARERWHHSLVSGEPFEMEYRWIRYDGELIWMLGRANPVRNDKDEIELWIGTVTDIHKQKQAEEKFRFLSDMMPQLVWVTDPDGFHNYFNERWTEYTGFSAEESYGPEIWKKLLHPDDRERSKVRWEHSLKTSEPYEIEYRFKSKEGKYRWFLGRAVPQQNHEGKTIQWFGSCTDIHDQKTKESHISTVSAITDATREIKDPVEIMAVTTRMLSQHLQTTRCAYAEVEDDEDFFTIVQDWSPDSPSTVGEYKLSAFGPQAEKDLRAGRDLVINDVDKELTPETGGNTFNAILIKAIICCPLIKEGRLVALMAVHQDTPRKWTQEEIQLVDNIVERCWASIERARSEAKLRQLNDELEIRVLERTKELAISEERFRLLAENASDLIARTTPDGYYIYLSPSVEPLLGYKPEELIGRNRNELLLPEDLQVVKSHIAENKDTGNKLSTVRVLHKNGHFVYMEVSMRSVMNPQTGQVVEVHSVARDITLRKQAEEALIRNNQELEQFAYVASHDMKEPLRMISSYTQLLLRKLQHPDEDIAIYSKYISDGVARMQALITDLLNYSRVGRQDAKFVEVNTNNSLAAVQNSLSILIQETGSQILAEPLPIVRAIPSLVHQLFQNLIENALKFRKPHISPVLKIACEEREHDWCFSVSDNGIGIDQKYREKVFVIFQRLHNREQYAGTGIGLAVCKKIVEFHGGHIWLQSTPGEGTTFFFTFPKIIS